MLKSLGEHSFLIESLEEGSGWRSMVLQKRNVRPDSNLQPSGVGHALAKPQRERKMTARQVQVLRNRSAERERTTVPL